VFDSDSENTPLQNKLAAFGDVVGFFAKCAAALCFIVLFIYWLASVGISSETFVSFNSLSYLVSNF